MNLSATYLTCRYTNVVHVPFGITHTHTLHQATQSANTALRNTGP